MSHTKLTVTVYACTCAKCKRRWTTNTDELPRTCPNPECRSTKWDKDPNGNPVEMPDDQPEVKQTKKDKRRARGTESGGIQTQAEVPAIAPRASNQAWEPKIWSDPVNRGNSCHYCQVGEGEPHKRACPQA